MKLYHTMRSFLHKFKPPMGNKRIPGSTPAPTFSCCASSPTEIQSQLKQVFNLIDSNGDGKISTAEFGNILLSLGHEKSTVAKEAEEMVREADCNGDGFVDLEEFMNAVSDKGSEEFDEDLKEAFLVFDKDRNGFISAKELRRVLLGLGIGKFTLKQCMLMIREVDKNGDGMVDFQEFRSLMNVGTPLQVESSL